MATLFYLARQMRHSAETSKAQTLAVQQATTHATLTLRAQGTQFVAGDPEIASLLWRGSSSPENLSADEWQRFFLVLGAIVRPIELAYIEYESGRMTEEIWAGSKNTILFWCTQPGWRRWLDEYGQTLYPNFVRYIQDLIGE